MNLFDKIDSYNFECEAGSLNNCTEFIELKERLKSLEKQVEIEQRLFKIIAEQSMETEGKLKEMQWFLKTAKAFDHEELIYKLIVLVDQALERN